MIIQVLKLFINTKAMRIKLRKKRDKYKVTLNFNKENKFRKIQFFGTIFLTLVVFILEDYE